MDNLPLQPLLLTTAPDRISWDFCMTATRQLDVRLASLILLIRMNIAGVQKCSFTFAIQGRGGRKWCDLADIHRPSVQGIVI